MFNISFTSKHGNFSFSYRKNIITAIGVMFISGGLALLNTPLWMFFVAFAASKAGINIDASINYYLSFILIAIGIILIGFKYLYLDKRNRLLKNDKKMIDRSPVEFKKIQAYFKQLITNHSYYSSMDDTFVQAYNQFHNTSQFLQDKKSNSLFRAFYNDAKELHVFVQRHFFPFPEGLHYSSDCKYCLLPDHNIDRAMLSHDNDKSREYEKISNELESLVHKTETSYNYFINRLKMLGYIL